MSPGWARLGHVGRVAALDGGREHGRRGCRRPGVRDVHVRVLPARTPSSTAWKDSCSAPVQTPMNAIVPETCSPAAVVAARSSPLALVVVAAAARRRPGSEAASRDRAGQALTFMHRLLSLFRRRSRVPSPGRRSAARACRRTTSTGSPSRTRERAPKRPTMRRPSAGRARRPRALGADVAAASSRISSVTAGRARRSVKCTIISEPSASRSSTSPAQPPVGRRVGRERASSRSSGRMPRITSRPSYVLQRRPRASIVSSPSAMRSLAGDGARAPPFVALERRLDACSSPGCR